VSGLDSDDRELWAVLVALEPLDDRKWNYVDLTRRTFDAERCLEEPWSSGERVLVEVAASLWNSGRVDLGYIACAMGGRHLQAVVDAVAIRAGQDVTSDIDTAVSRVGNSRRPAVSRPTGPRADLRRTRQVAVSPAERPAAGRER